MTPADVGTSVTSLTGPLPTPSPRLGASRLSRPTASEAPNTQLHPRPFGPKLCGPSLCLDFVPTPLSEWLHGWNPASQSNETADL